MKYIGERFTSAINTDTARRIAVGVGGVALAIGLISWSEGKTDAKHQEVQDCVAALTGTQDVPNMQTAHVYDEVAACLNTGGDPARAELYLDLDQDG